MNKICTSLEQSKKLIGLGIDFYTADNTYQQYKSYSPSNGITKGHCDIPVIGSWKKHHISIPDPSMPNADIPAWSFSALMGILPIFRVPTAFSDKVSVPSIIKTDNGYLLKYVGDFEIKINNGGDIEAPIEVLADTTIDAAFEMVCWLKENGKICHEKKNLKGLQGIMKIKL